MKLLGRDFDSEELQDWFNERPSVIKELIEKCPPAAFMVSKETGQLMQIVSWFEDGAVKVEIHQELNMHLSNALQDDYQVFGVNPDNLNFYCWPDDREKIDQWDGCITKH